MVWSLALVGCASDIQVANKANVAPAASITSPTNGVAVTSGVNVDFVGNASDANGLDDIQTVSWNSSLDGELISNGIAVPDNSGVSRFSTVLSPGVHAVTFRVVDGAGEVGEASISLSVGDAVVAPTVDIVEPELFSDFFLGQTIDMVASVADEQSPPEELEVVWTAENQDSGAVSTVLEVFATSQGLAIGSWTPLEIGDYLLTATVVDPDGNSGSTTVAIEVEDQGGADLDGDGFSPLNGDCNDNDPDIYPNAEEVCGDAIDNNCSGTVDDKDTDNDQHIDDACVNYVGKLPLDDCNDDESQVFPGASESPDGFDNDCDGFIDEDTEAFDDDGDCFCEVGPCVDSVNASCPSIDEGDCEDGDEFAFPGASDAPDMLFIDGDCDGVDGDTEDMVFLDPIAGSDANSGLLPTEAVRTWAEASTTARLNGRTWVAVSEGEVDIRSGSVGFDEGLNIAGGYDATYSWARGTSAEPIFEVAAEGEEIEDWAIPTEFQYIAIYADDATGSGASSIALVIDNSDGLYLNNVIVSAGNGSNGQAGASSPGFAGNGSGGNNGSGRSGGSGGGNCGSSGSGGGGGTGNDASCGLFSCSEGPGTAGSPGSSSGGSGGSGGGSNGGNGGVGFSGGSGTDGSNGIGGSSFGSVSFSFGYVPSPGTSGSVGLAGKAGGGGGGGGGDGDWPDSGDGGGGGGGGGGACGGLGGAGGTGGGASIAIVLDDSSLLVDSSLITAGTAGDGGSGGNGQIGGSGGNGGLGADGESTVTSDGGNGGNGGTGGAGGDGGFGGGGGGGPSIGIACVGGSVVNEMGTVITPGQAGSGGPSAGASGASGLEVDTDGCL